MEAERLTAVVVLPTPPFWFAMEMTITPLQYHTSFGFVQKGKGGLVKGEKTVMGNG
jgi:hypothetical protein